MEIPDKLKALYRHWEDHTLETRPSNTVLPSDLEDFISERMRIWERKQSGEERPFTQDSTLHGYKFCNIYRELDRQTIEIHTDLQYKRDDFPLWLLNVAFHRFICKPETVSKVGHLDFGTENNSKVYEKLIALPKPKFGDAYIFPVSTIMKSKFPTREEFFCFYLPGIIPQIAKEIESFDKTTVNEALERLLPIFGYNFKFHWTEILIDVAYQFPYKIDLFKDFHVGPGAMPTAKILFPGVDPVEAVNKCVGVRLNRFPFLTLDGKPIQLSAENWEGIFCEYRKYRNLKNGKGRKRKFKTHFIANISV